MVCIKYISPGFLAWALCLNCFSQVPSHQQFWNKIIAVENSAGNIDQKLQNALELKKQFEKYGIEKDSVYARILHRVGAFQSLKGNYNDAIENTIKAVRINTSGKPGACISYAVNSYYNLATFYNKLSIYNKVLLYCDSLISTGSQFPQAKKYIERGRLMKGNIYYKKGDFEKDIQETTLGLQIAEEIKDTPIVINLLEERVQSYEFQKRLSDALGDVNKLLFLLKNSSDNELWATACRDKAEILADQQKCTEAFDLYQKAIIYRKKTGYTEEIATDYNDAGYMLMYKCNDPGKAEKYFNTAYQIAFAANANNVCALACNNLAQISFDKKDYLIALQQYQQTLQFLVPHYLLKDNITNPPYYEFSGTGSKNLLEIYLDNKSKCLLYLYKQTNNTQFLKSSIATALLTDSLITDLHHEESGEESKLFWRNDTRDFYNRSMEACYLDKRPDLAFFFLEKSRAVLLNDQLNEIGASVHLPPTEEAHEEKLQVNIIEEQQKLNDLNDTSKEYPAQQYKLLQAKDDFDHYIKSLEKQYLAYYQSKYADDVPSLKDLQTYLTANNQSFVHYFIGDTATYILAITSNTTKFIRLSKKEFDNTLLIRFLQLCSDKELLNNHYDSFAKVSSELYQVLFQPLQLPKGRIVICADNFLIPFEALCSDKDGRRFLFYDHAFSYVYSARYLMRRFENSKAIGNFIGFAPVHFASYLEVPDLKQADNALQASALHYQSSKLLINSEATHSNFMKLAANYTIVNVFSHAHADSTNEPLLYMQDSVIHLSELQLLDHPAAKLIVLSACQTNVGKNATGEGIYSLARGFAAAGIPAVAATLWKADDQTIYAISDKFHEYLSQGMPKDVALQKAKLYFIENNSSEKMLPYYWANMVLAGNAEPVKLSTNLNEWWWVATGCIVLASITLFMLRKKRKKVA